MADGLTQEDFRKLLATPRPAAKSEGGAATSADGFAVPAAKKKKKQWKRLTKVPLIIHINLLLTIVHQ
jgi:hypothetical protein